MDIVNYLRKMRFLIAAVKELLPEYEVARILMKTEYMPVEILTVQ